MAPKELVPVLATILCLEMAFVFALVHAKVGRRKADLVFSILCFSLAWMTWASYLRAREVSVGAALFWTRMEYVGAFLAMTVFLHFVSIVVDEPPRPSMFVLMYAVGVGLALFSCTESFITAPGPWVRAQDLPGAAKGPLYPVVAPLPVVGALAAWVKLMRRSHGPRDAAFSPVAAHIPLVFLAGFLIIVAGALVIGVEILVPTYRLPFNAQSVGAVVFCVFTAAALGKELVRTEREKERLANLAQFRAQAVRDIAHELKNPLAAIQAATLTLREVELEPAERIELLGMCVDACRRLTRLINNMLDTARMEAGRDVELRPEPTNLPELVESVLALQRNTTAVHVFRLDSRLDAPVAAVDPDKLYQILTNLVGNAIKYSPNGGEVTVRLWREDAEVYFTISDQGIGMTPGQQARIFQPFERVADPGRRITGTGIGLHLVKRLVEALGGRIWVESEGGKGSTFGFTLLAPVAP